MANDSFLFIEYILGNDDAALNRTIIEILKLLTSISEDAKQIKQISNDAKVDCNKVEEMPIGKENKPNVKPEAVQKPENATATNP